MNRLINSGTLTVVGAFAALVAAAGSLLADGGRIAPVANPLVKKECGACHIAYPAGLLPAAAWRGVMNGLNDHFGENAELDAAATRKIEDYLAANAGADRRSAGGQPIALRITEQPWWTRKHEKRGRVSDRALARAGAKSKADCKACHQGAEQGLFEDN